MLQHILLLTVAPPLILLGRPWPTMWRALPLARAPTSRAKSRSRHSRRRCASSSGPLAAWIVFNATIVVWHIPGAYDLTERNGVVHACEHAMFFFFGLLFWARVIDVGPLRPRLRVAGADRLHRRRDDRRLAARDRVRHRATADLRALRGAPEPSRRYQRADRPAARRRDDVGGGVDRLHDRAAGRRLPLARARAAAAPTRARALRPRPPPQSPSGHQNGSPVPALREGSLTT